MGAAQHHLGKNVPCAGGWGRACGPRSLKNSPSLSLMAKQVASQSGLSLSLLGEQIRRPRSVHIAPLREPPRLHRAEREMSQHFGASALAASGLQSENARNCRPHWWIRDLPSTPKCLDLVEGSCAPRQGNGPDALQVPDWPSSPQQPRGPEAPHLAEALLGSLGFCVAGGHGAAHQAQVVPGLMHHPQESRELSEPGPLALTGAHPAVRSPHRHGGEAFRVAEAGAGGCQALASLTASALPAVPSALTCPR